jgi:hypothetical protein
MMKLKPLKSLKIKIVSVLKYLIVIFYTKQVGTVPENLHERNVLFKYISVRPFR